MHNPNPRTHPPRILALRLQKIALQRRHIPVRAIPGIIHIPGLRQQHQLPQARHPAHNIHVEMPKVLRVPHLQDHVLDRDGFARGEVLEHAVGAAHRVVREGDVGAVRRGVGAEAGRVAGERFGAGFVVRVQEGGHRCRRREGFGEAALAVEHLALAGDGHGAGGGERVVPDLEAELEGELREESECL